MTTTTIFFITSTTLILAGLLLFKTKTTATFRTQEIKPAIQYNTEEAKMFVKKLSDLGYFKYADPKDIETLQKNMINEYDPTNEMACIWDEKTLTPKDYRYYICDNETLFEEGGLTGILKDLEPTFNKIGLVWNVTDYYEVWDDNKKWLNQTITINGTKYIVFKNFTETGWGQAVQRLVEILNSELTKQYKEDRVYPVSGGNDGRIIFLSDEQFNYIDRIYKNPNWKPLRLMEWCKVMDVKYMKID